MKKIITFGAGVLVGAALFGGSVAIAAGILATPTTSRVFVNGSEVKIEAYHIDGTNYFRLRDIGAEIGFSIVWDGDGQRILIDTSHGYDANETYAPQPTETPTPTTPNAALSVAERIEYVKHNDIIGLITTGDAVPGKLANGKDITEANLAAMFAEIETIFSDGTSWGDGTNGGTKYTHVSQITSGTGCNAWAGMVADLLWGKDAAYTTHSDLAKAKTGDVVLLRDGNDVDIHWFVVRGVGLDPVGGWSIMQTCEGNVAAKVSWDSRPIKGTANDYPNSIIYSFY